MSSLTSTMPTPLTLIVAATTLTLGIGKSGGLPWRLKNEIAYFARVTKRLVPTAPTTSKTKNAVIMGRKTWESIPVRFRPLPDRINVVVSRSSSEEGGGGGGGGGAVWARSLDDALEKLDSGEDGEVGRIFVIGGAQLYETAIKHPRTRSILLTNVHQEFEADTFFPVDMKDPGSGWAKKTHKELGEFVGEKVPEGMEEGGVTYDFELYEKDS